MEKLKIKVKEGVAAKYKPEEGKPGWGFYNTMKRVEGRNLIVEKRGDGYLSPPIYGVSVSHFLVGLDDADEIPMPEQEKV